MSRPLTIAIDFDETYTADRELFDKFIAEAQARGHRVICVTCREATPENRETCLVPGVSTYFCDGGSKIEHLKLWGVRVDIWLDDDPRCILFGK